MLNRIDLEGEINLIESRIRLTQKAIEDVFLERRKHDKRDKDQSHLVKV